MKKKNEKNKGNRNVKKKKKPKRHIVVNYHENANFPNL